MRWLPMHYLQFEEVTKPAGLPSKDHWPPCIRTFFQSDDKLLVMESIAFLHSVLRVGFPEMYAVLHSAA